MTKEVNIWLNITNDMKNDISKVMSNKLVNVSIGPKTRILCMDIFKQRLVLKELNGTIEEEVIKVIEYTITYVSNELGFNPEIY